MSELVTRFGLIFLAGAVLGLLAVQFLRGQEKFSILGERGSGVVSGEKTPETKSLPQTLLEKVLPAAAENPILAPVKKAGEDIGQTVKTIQELPQEQKNTICREICGSP